MTVLRRSTAASERPVVVCAPAADVGWGVDAETIGGCLSRGVDAIALQGTSTDPGPYYLGTGSSYIPESVVVRDLQTLIPLALEAGAPLLVSVGGCGTDGGVSQVVEQIKSWAREARVSFRLCTIYTSISRDHLLALLEREGEILALREARGPIGPHLSPAQVADAANIVAQVGPEPLVRAVKQGANVVVCGRILDVALFAAIPLARGIPSEVALVMGKVLECGALATESGSPIEGVIGTAWDAYFEVRPTHASACCTPRSVMAQLLYEESSGERIAFPGGAVDIRNVECRAVDAHTVRVSGARWERADRLLVKVEGARRVGFRAISIASIADPRVASALPAALEDAQRLTSERFDLRYPIRFLRYGTGVPGCGDVSLVIDIVADDEDAAVDAADFASSYLLHFGFPGRSNTAGNLAFPFSPNVIRVGAVFEFNIWHLVPVQDPEELCSVHWETVA